MLDLRSMAAALGGVISKDQVLAPGPGHSQADRSLSVKLDPNAPDDSSSTALPVMIRSHARTSSAKNVD